VVQAARVRDREVGHVATKVPDELLLRPEGEPAYPGVQPVRADHKAEPPHGAAGERHRDAVPVLGQPDDPVVEQVFGSLAGGVVQDAGQVAAHDLDLRDHSLAVEQVGRHPRGPAAATVHIGESALVDTLRPYLVKKPHPLDHLASGAAQVHCVPARSGRGPDVPPPPRQRQGRVAGVHDGQRAGETPLPARPPKGWRAQLELSSRTQWQGFRRHPWLAPALSITRPQLMPTGMRHTEWALRALDGLGLTIQEMMYVHVTLFSHVRGLALNLEAEAQAEQDSGLTSDEWMQTQEHGFRVIAGTGDFPLLDRLVDSETELDLDQLFEFGLGHCWTAWSGTWSDGESAPHRPLLVWARAVAMLSVTASGIVCTGGRIDRPGPGDGERAGQCCILGSWVGSAYMGGQPRSIASVRSS
jgi:hypothetical protein